VEIRRRAPDATIFGLGGQRMMAGGGELVADYHGLSVTGLVEALSVVPRSFSLIGRLTALARSERPDVAVIIDFPDFHLGFAGLGLAPRLKALGIPIVYYIPPQLWAWRRSRLKLIKHVADRVLVIFPFEEALYQEAGIPVEFVGHPLIDLGAGTGAAGRLSSRHWHRSDPPVVALLPGSRRNEVERLLPVMRDAAVMLSAQFQASSSSSRVPLAWTMTCSGNIHGPAIVPLKCWRGPMTFWRWLMPPSRPQARPRYRPPFTACRWWWSTSCRRRRTAWGAGSSTWTRLPWRT
jgi:lipid A disaccharide synthetase